MNKRNLYYMYDAVWSGRHMDFKSFYEETMPKMEPEDILEICRYAFAYYLQWSPDTVYANMNIALLKKLKLYNLVSRVYPFPTELSGEAKVKYLIGAIYPQYYQFDQSRSTEDAFRQVNDGEIPKLPKGFFANTEEGKQRAKICFRYMLNHYYMFKGYEEIFYFFSTTSGRQFLAKYHLKQPIRNFGTVADMVFESFEDLGMSDEEREECILYKEKFKSQLFMDRYIRKTKKERRAQRKEGKS